MATQPSRGYMPQRSQAERQRRFEMASRNQGAGEFPWGLVLTGAAIGLGIWAWYQFGPDFRRYMKIRNM